MAARAVLVPMSGGAGGANAAISGLNDFANSMQKLSSNDLARAKELIDVRGKQRDLAATQTSRDVLQDTTKSEEVLSGVNNVYDTVDKKYEDGRNILEEEFQRSVGTLPKKIRNADGSYGDNPEYLDKVQKKEDLLKDWDLKYYSKIDELNKQIPIAEQSGAFNKVTNPDVYANRIYQEAISRGLTPTEAEALRKQEYERVKEKDLTDRDKAELTLLNKSFDTKNKATELFGDKYQTTASNAVGTAGTGAGVGGTNAAAKKIADVKAKQIEDNIYETGPKVYTQEKANLNDMTETMDLKPWIGSDLTIQEIHDLDAKLKKTLGTDKYNPAMLKNVLETKVANRDGIISDTNIPVNTKKDKFFEDIINGVVTESANNEKRKADVLNVYNTAYGSTGNKNTTQKTLSGYANKKELLEQISKNEQERQSKSREILNRGKKQSADDIVKSIFGDTSKYDLNVGGLRNVFNPPEEPQTPKGNTNTQVTQTKAPVAPNRGILTDPKAQTTNDKLVEADYQRQAKAMDTYEKFQDEMETNPAQEALPQVKKALESKEFKNLSPEIQKIIIEKLGPQKPSTEPTGYGGIFRNRELPNINSTSRYDETLANNFLRELNLLPEQQPTNTEPPTDSEFIPEYQDYKTNKAGRRAAREDRANTLQTINQGKDEFIKQQQANRDLLDRWEKATPAQRKVLETEAKNRQILNTDGVDQRGVIPEAKFTPFDVGVNPKDVEEPSKAMLGKASEYITDKRKKEFKTQEEINSTLSQPVSLIQAMIKTDRQDSDILPIIRDMYPDADEESLISILNEFKRVAK